MPSSGSDVADEVVDASSAAAAAADAEASIAAMPKLTLDILGLIQEAQQSNGLRQRNYLRYRQYCSRRLRRLRCSVRLLQGSGRTGKFVGRKLLPEMASVDRHVMLPLFNAERAWSFAMQLKQEIDAGDAPRRARFHLVRRLTKAALHAKELAQLCSVRADTRTALEADAYAASMAASLHLEKEDLADALTSFTRAEKLLQSLASVGDTDQRGLCMQRLEAIQPNIRYCRYMLAKKAQNGGKNSHGISSSSSSKAGEGDEGGEDTQLGIAADDNVDELLRSKIETVLAESRASQAVALDHVQWKGEPVPILSADIRLCILQARERVAFIPSSSSSSSSSSEAAEKQLADCSTAFNHFDEARALIAAELVKLGNLKPRGASIEAQENQMRSLDEYICYSKLEVMRKRNELLVARLRTDYDAQQAGLRSRSARRVRPDDIVVMFEKLAQNLGDASKLRDSEQDNDTRLQNEARLQEWKALRLFYCSESFRLSQRWTEANAFLERCCTAASEAIQCYSDLNDATAVQSLEDLLTKARAIEVQLRACAALTSLGLPPTGYVKNRDVPVVDPLLKRLPEFESGSASQLYRLTDIPPPFSSTVCKPVLFDLAWDGIDYTEISEAQPKKGWGLLSRLWG